MTISNLKNGDVVQHTILGTDKVIVGVGNDRFLCVRLEDIGPDGRIRPNAHVAMHRGINLQKVGHRDNVVEINLNDLYQEEAFSRHPFPRPWFRQETLAKGLFILAAILIILVFLSGIDVARREILRMMDRKTESIKTKPHEEYQQEHELRRG